MSLKGKINQDIIANCQYDLDSLKPERTGTQYIKMAQVADGINMKFMKIIPEIIK